ncbi:MAG: quinolinate synthase NadA, partial [Granulosicoccaceae bacterium]
ATDNGILHKMKQRYPEATFLAAPTAGESATCKSCAFCPWMAMNDLRNLVSTLENLSNQVEVDETVRVKAVAGLDRMLAFAAEAGIGGAKPGDNPGVGPA